MLIKDAFQAILENTSDMIFVKNKNFEYVAASIPFIKMTGNKCLEDILYKKDEDIFEDKELAKRYMADDYQLYESGNNLFNYIEPITDKDGLPRYGATSKYILRDSDGNFNGLVGVTKDITREFIARQNYQQELKYLFELPEDTYAIAYVDVDDYRVISQRRQNIGNSTLPLIDTVDELFMRAYEAIQDKDSEAAAFYRTFDKIKLNEIYKTGKRRLSFQYKRRMTDQSLRWIKNEVHFLVDADNGHLCMLVSAKDINLQKQEEFELEKAAKMDKMTMLFNHETVMYIIEKFLKEYPGNEHALFMIDLDNFKLVNDTYGHMEGDSLLKSVADEIRKCFREDDIKGRVGGDEFFVLMHNVPNQEIIERKAELLLRKIEKLGEKYSDFMVSGSIGISCFPKDGQELKELYEKADEALYHAKRNGKNRFVLYNKISKN